MGVDVEGKKHILGIEPGATENAASVKRLLTHLRDHELPTDRKYLFVIDGPPATQTWFARNWVFSYSFRRPLSATSTKYFYSAIPLRSEEYWSSPNSTNRTGVAAGIRFKGVAMSEMTIPMAAANLGDSKALNQLFTDCYQELRRLAHARLQRNRAGTLLDTTALVHESYCRFLNAGMIQITDRCYFMAYAARVMRSIIVDLIRERLSQPIRVDLEDLPVPVSKGESEILHVHQALEQLALISERLVRVVEMRYFAGMTEPEIGQALGITERTVRRDWEKARMLLAANLTCKAGCPV